MIEHQLALYGIAAIATGYALLSQLLIRLLGDPKKVKEIQEESKQLSKEMGEAVKAKDERRIEEINKRYEAYFPKMGQLMMLQLKPMIVILPLLFLLTPFIKETFEGFIITLPVQLPIFIQNLEKFPNWRDTFGPLGWFWLCVIFGGLAISLIKGLWEKHMGAAEAVPVPEKKAESQGPSS